MLGGRKAPLKLVCFHFKRIPRIYKEFKGRERVGIEATCPCFSGKYKDPVEERASSWKLLCVNYCS